MSNEKDVRKLLDRYFPDNDIPILENGINAEKSQGWASGPRNSYGYRSDEFDDRGDFNIAYLGCSWVEGYGVERDEIFSEIVSRRVQEETGLSVRSWNFGHSGTGFDYVARLAPSVINHLRPDLVVLVVSGAKRREYFSASGKRMFWNITVPRRYRERGQKPSEMEQGIIDAFGVLQNEFNDIADFLRSFRLLASLLDARKIPWLYSWIDHKLADQQMQLLFDNCALPIQNFLGQKFKKVDFSKIDKHPGIESHERFAELIVSHLIEKGLLKGEIREKELKKSANPAVDFNEKPFPFKPANRQQNIKFMTQDDEDDDVYPLW